jgi:hypothetical protein
LLSKFELVERDPQRAHAYAYAHEQAHRAREGKPSGMRVLMERLSKEIDANAIEAAKNDAESMLRSWGSDALQPQTKSTNSDVDGNDLCYSR